MLSEWAMMMRNISNGIKAKVGTSMPILRDEAYAIELFREQMDSGTVLRNSGLLDLVPMDVPQGVQNENASVWNKPLDRVFLRKGFKSCGAVYYEYTRFYVEDVINAANTSILGMDIGHDTNYGTLVGKQTRYIDDILKQFGQLNT
ncbi:polyprotein [Phytophthora megakarya]|uniref:Polyprotein n=1 Tax=Phytophthora megakarya TaxID=4795 RepID=A0A225W9F0_9STRA|nr:polyprotein [Phytophthora megakarya]